MYSMHLDTEHPIHPVQQKDNPVKPYPGLIQQGPHERQGFVKALKPYQSLISGQF